MSFQTRAAHRSSSIARTWGRRLLSSAYLFKRLAVDRDHQRFAPSGEAALRLRVPAEPGVADVARGWGTSPGRSKETVKVDLYLDRRLVGHVACDKGPNQAK